MGDKENILESVKQGVKEALNGNCLKQHVHSIYLFGSILQEHYRDEESDVDMMVILNPDSSTDRMQLNDLIKSELTKLNKIAKVDINVCYSNEINFPLNRFPFYFEMLRRIGLCIYGKPIKHVDKITADTLYLSVRTDLHECRRVYVNEVDLYLIEYFRKQLRSYVMNVYYLEHGLEKDDREVIRKFIREHPEFGELNVVFEKSRGIRTVKRLLVSFERLAAYLRQKYKI